MAMRMHAGLAGYLARHQVPADGLRDDGAFELVFDEKYRVLCWTAPGGDMVLEARLAELPEDEALCESIMKGVLQNACRRFHAHADALALSETGNALMLQQRVAAEAGADDVENGLETFVNAVAGWRQSLDIN